MCGSTRRVPNRRATQLDPNSAAAHSALALVLAQAGQRDAAIQENLTVLKLAPNDPSTLRNLALLYRDAGRLNDALTYGRKALELGLRYYSRAELEAARTSGELLHINVLGLASIAHDVTAELARASIASVTVLGALQASAEVKAALADRTL